MRTLHFGLKVADRSRSLAFYTALGYLVVGEVPETPFGHLTMLRLPGDEFVTLELVHKPDTPVVGGPHHFVVVVPDLDAAIADLATRGLVADSRGGAPGEVQTAWLTDPDGTRVELVQWPPGHADGISEADWAGSAG